MWLVLIWKQNQDNDSIQYFFIKVIIEKKNHRQKIFGMKRNKACASLKHLQFQT
jgi:hypothetical protein